MKKQLTVLNYELPITIVPLEEGGYLARVESLQGCMAEGKTIEDTLSSIADVARQIITIRKEEGLDIPLRIMQEKQTRSKINFSLPLAYHA